MSKDLEKLVEEKDLEKLLSEAEEKDVDETEKDAEEKEADSDEDKETVKEETDVDSDEDKEDEKDEDLKESVEKIFEGMDLSEEFKFKVSTLFEARLKDLVETKTQALEEKYEAELSESITAIEESLIESIDTYMSAMANEWFENNKLAVETGIRVQVAESLYSAMETLLKEHNVSVPVEKIDAYAELENTVNDLKESLENTTKESLDKNNTILSLEKQIAFSELSEGLSDLEVEKLKQLVEDVDAITIDSFKDKVKVIRESFFAKALKEDKQEDLITEQKTVSKKDPVLSTMARLNRKQ